MTPRPRLFRDVPVGGGGAAGPRSLHRADIEVAGLDQAGPSYELRVFLNAPAADADTPATPESGYAGSIYVYGYGEPAAAEPRVPTTRSIIATEAVARARAAGPAADVTLVPVSFEGGPAAVDLDAVDVAVLVDEG